MYWYNFAASFVTLLCNTVLMSLLFILLLIAALDLDN